MTETNAHLYSVRVTTGLDWFRALSEDAYLEQPTKTEKPLQFGPGERGHWSSGRTNPGFNLHGYGFVECESLLTPDPPIIPRSCFASTAASRFQERYYDPDDKRNVAVQYRDATDLFWVVRNGTLMLQEFGGVDYSKEMMFRFEEAE
jgi:hypothetical protein